MDYDSPIDDLVLRSLVARANACSFLMEPPMPKRQIPRNSLKGTLAEYPDVETSERLDREAEAFLNRR